MIRSSAFAIPLLLLSACSAPVAEDPTPVADTTAISEVKVDRLTSEELIGALIGKWISEQGDDSTVFHEQWERIDPTHLQGIGFVMLRNDTVSIEHLNINVTDSGTFYAAQIPSQNDGVPVYFELQPGTDSLVFVNASHDFPQRIVYSPADPIGWTATVSGPVDGERRAMQFHLRPRE